MGDSTGAPELACKSAVEAGEEKEEWRWSPKFQREFRKHDQPWDGPPIAHLSGTKKAKLIQALTNQADSFIQELWQNKMFEGQNKKNMVWHMME